MKKTYHTILKLLAFNLTRAEMLKFSTTHLIVGVIGTWLVGMGRYWDNPQASLLQHLGLGSVIYIFTLAAFIWIIILPFQIKKWSYKIVLTYISLTSFPAIFYAIPVDRFLTLQTANHINFWFLAIVAGWRLGLLYSLLKIFSGLNLSTILTVTLMPICLIITTLTVLNLERAVFDIMGGVRDQTANDSAYAFLVFLTVISAILTLPLLIAYGVAIYNSRKNHKLEQKQLIQNN